jgi:predicted tellurium resistance membrane protein TerC
MTELIVALVTLTILEIILGVDNVIFVSILSGKLPKAQQKRARRIGMLAAMLMRIALLFTINWIAHLTEPLFNIASRDISGRDLILVGGGLFLLAKATFEIHDRLEGHVARRVSQARRLVQQRDRSSHGPRHRVFARFGHHRHLAWRMTSG